MSRRNLTFIVLVAIAAIIAAACSTSGGASASPSAAASASASASAAPSESASASASVSAEPSASASASAAAEATVEVTQLKDFGPALYGGESGLTVYTFTKDTKDSGKSACSGGCITTWPALTVAAGETPSAGEGVTGKLGTITRDDGTLQVTYNGLPLYFFKNDKVEGDANGIYENWNAVKP